MMKIKALFSEIKFCREIAGRFSRVDRKSRSSVTSRLAATGICFGVMTLIVVLSVMNGFQNTFIASIQELSSYHLQVSCVGDEKNLQKKLDDFALQNKNVKTIVPFYEAQTLMTFTDKHKRIREGAALIRALPSDVINKDSGFYKELNLITGFFDIESPDSIVLGCDLARNLGVNLGDSVNLFVLSGSSDVELFSGERNFTITGIFASGYQEINSTYCFVNTAAALKYFGKAAKPVFGIKLKRISRAEQTGAKLSEFLGENSSVKNWKEFNKSFYGTLRMEKDILLLLVCLIFVVVGVNIFNGMRRLVFERQSEIAILSALGARSRTIQLIFVTRGFITGIAGSALGLVLGIIISMNTDIVFNSAAKIMYFFEYVFTAITDRENLMYVSENSSYSIYASIPAIIHGGEAAMTFLFGFLSPLAACFAASKNVLKLQVSEVLHNE